jgi:hypothetical protein
VSERPGWDFQYAPIPLGRRRSDLESGNDLVLATEDDVDTGRIAELISAMVRNVELTPLFSAHPVFWTRLASPEPIDRGRLIGILGASGIKVRYVAEARHGSQQLAPPLVVDGSRPRRATDWRARGPSVGREPASPWRWFLRSAGANVERSSCGTGTGTRLAVIDNDGRDLDRIELDAEVLVGVTEVPRAGAHAALLLGWAVGAGSSEGNAFRGVAPDASPRLYCIPKAVDEIVSLPLAIVRAVEDGADVIVCATAVEGQSSPLLDDALTFATTLGRMGRGTIVVMPTGREMSSPAESVHSSLSLGLAEPASDPRVFCIGPSARDGGWFLWRDRRGKIRPFANRGPAVRWLAPGDDLAYPFADNDQPAHAESSGASAVAAGVILLVLARNPGLQLTELDQLLQETVVSIDPGLHSTDSELGDRADLFPLGCDADGHNAKHGYGRLNASVACLAASDPVCAALIRVGARQAAERYDRARSDRTVQFYSDALARWAARVHLRDAVLRQTLCSLARAARLGSRYPDSIAKQPPGHWIRQIALAVRLLLRASPPPEIAGELSTLEVRLRTLLGDQGEAFLAEQGLFSFVADLHRVSGRDVRAVTDGSSGVGEVVSPRTSLSGTAPSKRGSAPH